MDLVKCCFSPLCSCMQSPVVRQDMSNVFYTKEKLDDLENTMNDLKAKEKDIRKDLNDPQHKGKRLPNNQHQLEQWLHNVGEKIAKVEQLLDEYRRGNCVAGSCSLNCFSRYKISRNAIILKEQITQLTTKHPELKFTGIPPPKSVPESYKIVGKKIISNLDIARSYLADERVGMIGIWGMGGVGKTTLLKKINQSLLDDATMGFDHVLFIEASQNIQSEKLREQIVKELQLASLAGKKEIFHALKTKNFVLLLDNIWDEVDLLDLGIPHPYSNNNSTNQYKHKVMFTTRSEDVCARMGARENERIKVQCLDQDESWVLFKDNVNLDVIESDEKFKKIAMRVMEKCGGLPLALKVIGKALSNKKNVQYWESLLQNSGTPNVQGVEESLLPILKFSYDVLDTNIQKCFLFASILRGSYKIYVLECWMGLGLICDFDNLQEAYGKAEHIFNTLEESCLLYFISFDYRVEVHDVIYEMAMWIASDCGMNMNKWIVERYDGSTAEIPSIDAENWRFANKVIVSGRVELSPILFRQCSDLKCLMIKDNPNLKSIPEGLFRQMPNLTYLDLSKTKIEELPKDIKFLVNLQYLNISGTWISTLPKELLSLNKLEYLICRHLWFDGKVEDGLLSKLDKLKVIDLYPSSCVEPEELKLLKKHNSIKAIGMCVRSQEVLQQLSCLPITRLCIQFLDNLDFLSLDSLSCKHHGFLEELEIGYCPQLERLEMKGNKTTRLYHLKIHYVKKLQDIIWADNISPPEFFHMLKTLDISGCNLGNFAWVLHLPCLSELRIENCAVVETLFYVQEREIQEKLSSEQPMFPTLKYLYLERLPKLVSISNFALDFPQLLWLTVVECAEIETLFCIEEEEREIQQKPSSKQPMFPALKDLYLKKLQKLVSISNVALDFPRLSIFTVHQCVNVKNLPFKKCGVKNNERAIHITCDRKWWESLEWDDATTIPSHFQLHLYK